MKQETLCPAWAYFDDEKRGGIFPTDAAGKKTLERYLSDGRTTSYKYTT